MNGTAAAFLAIPEAILLALIAAGTGRRLLGLLLPDATPLERSALGFPAALAVLSVAVTVLLFTGVPPAVLLAAVVGIVAAAAAWGFRSSLDLLRDLREFARTSPVAAALLAASAYLGLIGCMAPETGWDTGVYHFAMARMRAEQGGMVVRLDVSHGYRPAYMESLQTVGFLFNGETLASLFNLMIYFAGAGVARLWGERIEGARGGLFAALAWMTPATYVLRMDGGDVEVAQAVYFGAALYALLRLRDGAPGGWRVFAGGALGLLCGMKYASLYATVILAAVWLAVRLKDRAGLRVLAQDAVLVGGLAVVIACPWYLRNKIATGTPFYPFQQNGGGVWNGEAVEEGAGKVLLRALALDGVAILGLAGLLVPGAARVRWTAAVPVILLLWMLRQLGFVPGGVSNAVRYASAAWMPLLALAGAGAAWAYGRGGLLRIAGFGTLLAMLALGQGILAARNLRKLPAAVGLADRQGYLEARVSTAAAIRTAEAGLPAGKKILLVEERVYYCRSPFLAASDIQYGVDMETIRRPEDLDRFLAAERIGAIVVDRSPNAKIWRFRAMEKRLGPAWPPRGVTEAAVEGTASLYRVER